MERLGVGVLGYGFMGRLHTFAHRTIPFHYDAPPARAELKVVCTSRAETAEAARAAGGFERCTTDPDEVTGADDVDVVHICTPNHLHFAALTAAIEAGKHIYCDKPVTASLREAERIEAMLPGYRGAGQTVLQYRFLPATIRARQLVEEGFLGRITHFRACYLHSGSVDPQKAVNWKSTAAAGGGVIRDLGAHVLDLVLWLVGSFDVVCCAGRVWSPQRPDGNQPGEMMTVDAEEGAAMVLRREDGAFGTVEASKIATGTEDELRFEIHGRHGAMRFNLMQPNYLEIYDGRLADGDYGGRRGWQQIAAVQRYPGSAFPPPKVGIGWTRAHVHCLYSFLKAIVGGTPPSPSLADGLYLQRVLETARASAESGTWEELPRPG